MKKSRIIVILIAAATALLALGACTGIEEPDYRELDYGHVQFKLYKYQQAVKAGESAGEKKPVLDSLYEARKIQVSMIYEGREIRQTLVFQAASPETADYGLRSDKLKLLAGTYKINSFKLFDKEDFNFYDSKSHNIEEEFTVKAGGLTVHNLTADTKLRGKVKFTLVKDMSELTRAITSEREYTFDEIKCFDVTVFNNNTSATYTFGRLPLEFGIHFEDEQARENPDWITSSSVCDSLLVLEAGEYTIKELKLYDEDSKNAKVIEIQKETAAFAEERYRFSVSDNKITEAKLPVTLHGTPDYIKDYMALKSIWESLNGEEWSYFGENFPKGTNWNFDKDMDLWGDQPGVKLHNNGRVALIDISEFGFSGTVPAAIGDLTELVELYLGTHNDNNVYYSLTDNSSSALSSSPIAPGRNHEIGDLSRNRMERNREYLRNIHTLTQLSGPSAFALKEKNKYIPEIKLYNRFTENEIFDTKGRQMTIRPMDMNHGTICNGMTEIHEDISKCKKLETLYIANSRLSKLPDLGELDLLANFEIYNCPELKAISAQIAGMDGLTQVNFANNRQWEEAEAQAIIEAMGNSGSAEKLQILYFRQNNLKKMDFRKFKALGLLDLAYNNIDEVVGFGKKFSLEQIHLQNNKITEIPDDFCGTDGVETISLAGNRLTKFPNCFSSKALYVMGSLDLSYNQISEFPADFKGISVNSLSLVENKLTSFPEEFVKSNSLIGTLNLRGNQISKFSKEALDFTYDINNPNNPGDPELGEWEEYDPTYSNIALMSVMDLSYNRLSDLPQEFSALTIPNLQSIDLSHNNFSKFPFEPFYCSALVVYAIRNQTYPVGHDKEGQRSLKEWPTNYAQHAALRGLYLGGNDLRTIDDNISYICYNLEISDNPNIVFDASDICWWWQNGMFTLLYDKTQKIINCDAMLD